MYGFTSTYKIMKPLYLALLITLAALMFSCNRHKKHKDPYYTDHGDWDDVRFPIIKPYEAICLNGTNTWFVQLTHDVDDHFFSAPGTKEIAVLDNMIFLHSTNTILNYAEAKEAWFVLIPAKDIEKGFATHMSYQDYLHSVGISHEPKLYSMNQVSRYFGNHDTIDWQNINQ
jgi:hypothetical protein